MVTFGFELAGAFLAGMLVAVVGIGLAVKYLGPRYLRRKLTGAMLDFTPPKQT